MMSDINITTSVVQLPNIQGMAGAQLAYPEVQQAMAAQLAQQALKEKDFQVQKVEKQDASEAVKDEKRKGRGGSNDQRRRTRQAAPEQEAQADDQPGAASPWLGHLVNRKV
jgi:hypothetical protein